MKPTEIVFPIANRSVMEAVSDLELENLTVEEYRQEQWRSMMIRMSAKMVAEKTYTLSVSATATATARATYPRLSFYNLFKLWFAEHHSERYLFRWARRLGLWVYDRVEFVTAYDTNTVTEEDEVTYHTRFCPHIKTPNETAHVAWLRAEDLQELLDSASGEPDGS